MAGIAADSPHLTLRDYLVPIKERRWLIIAIVVAITAAVSAYESAHPKTYTATTKVYVGQQSASGSVGAAQATPEEMANQAVLLTSTEVAALVAKKLGYTGSPAALAASVSAAPSQTTAFITITAQGSSATEAARVANAFAQEFIVQNSSQQQAANNVQIAGLRRQLKSLKGPVNVTQRLSVNQQIQQLQLANRTSVGAPTQIDVAQGAAATGHSVWEYAGLAAIAALIGSILLAFMLHRLDPRLKSIDQAADIYSLPVLATVAHDGDINHFHDGAPGLSARSRESFRDLRVSLALAAPGQRLATVMVTSAGSGEGKSTVARNLALALAEAGQRVALFDADLRKGSLAVKMGTEPRPGLTEVLAGLNTLDEVKTEIQVAALAVPGLEAMVDRLGSAPTEYAGAGVSVSVTIIPAGTSPANPPAVIESAAFEELLQQVADEHDVVVIDTTPVTAVSDAIPLISRVSAVLLVARSDITDRRTARRATQMIGRVPGANVVGLVVNDVPAAEAAAYGVGYGYARYEYRDLNGGTAEPEQADTAPSSSRNPS
jgi:Mrp family chromosome partitioning ATPase/capsular polysaccharide biosynthesis protein